MLTIIFTKAKLIAKMNNNRLVLRMPSFATKKTQRNIFLFSITVWFVSIGLGKTCSFQRLLWFFFWRVLKAKFLVVSCFSFKGNNHLLCDGVSICSCASAGTFHTLRFKPITSNSTIYTSIFIFVVNTKHRLNVSVQLALSVFITYMSGEKIQKSAHLNTLT